ncbi:MAG: bifunctional DNA-formamidopyrimidine glycosylase/DNA-(apurinic or apyrimidinic site) lyase [Neisseriaceae bacterium]|nr:bifunctional DNA-formamidopyrimidine glycosylase/DNA-(apurinic or apyrimidinic site) lyase [Neisseriaceae bacterium]
MPELPEVEITRQGITPHIAGKTVSQVIVRNGNLRRKVRPDLPQILDNATLKCTQRRAKYIVLEFDLGVLIIHLGMSGSLRIILPNHPTPLKKHDHIDLLFTDGTILRYHDPRRFGLFEWFYGVSEKASILQNLGVEPLLDKFNGDFLYQSLQNKKTAIKTALMSGTIVVGVGNIYANEALFMAKINPKRLSGSVKRKECNALSEAIKEVLQLSIQQGGSTLRDFTHSDGSHGYFQQYYRVYGKENAPCSICGTLIERIVQNQRSSFFCPNCQK